MNKFSFKSINGSITVPGDKSISHRAVFLASLSEKPITIEGLQESQAVKCSIDIMKQCAVPIYKKNNKYYIEGKGLFGLKEPTQILDAGNSGTTIRIVSGILGAQNFYSVITGDYSLIERPMGRIIKPLHKMGINIYGKNNNRFAPLTILPANKIKGITYKMPLPSAQVKSAILFAGLYSKKEVIINEPISTQNHTERMFSFFNIPLEIKKNRIILNNQAQSIKGKNITIPGDFSSAAYYIVAALITPNSKVLIKNVGLNQTRIGLIKVLQRMGGRIEIKNTRIKNNEPIGDVTAYSSRLIGTEIKDDEIPFLINEIPILSIAAVAAQGRTTITGAHELRIKESDRIEAITSNLKLLGVDVKEFEDGFVIKGTDDLNAQKPLKSYNDHRIVMSLIVASGLIKNRIIIDNTDSLKTSYPNFINDFTRISK